MWLDRLAGNQANSSGPSTPQPASRPYSPAPRRTSSTLSPYTTSSRPGHSARASSVSLVSNDSTTSLLISGRKLNGSGGRQPSTNDHRATPARVLARLLGSDHEDDGSEDFIKESDLELGVDFGGLDLRELAQEKIDDQVVVNGLALQSFQQCRSMLASGKITVVTNRSFTRRERESQIRGSAQGYRKLR
jgi:vacuolar protein sorting-associated protein 52